jgi:hypothetical protein
LWVHIENSCPSTAQVDYTVAQQTVKICWVQTQVVAGKNFKINYHFNGENYELVAYQPLGQGQPLQLTSCAMTSAGR